MQIYLVRHAPAGVRDAARWPDDALRPLTKPGVRKFRRAARGLGRFVSKVDIVLSSPMVRAWETAIILQEQAAWPGPVACNELREAPASEVIRVLRAQEPHASIALVGHEPYLSRVGSAILSPAGGYSIELKKGSAACIRIDDLETLGGAVLEWLLPPRALRGLA